MVDKKKKVRIYHRVETNVDLPGRRGVVRVRKILDPGDHLRRREARAITLYSETLGQKTWHISGIERIGTFKVNGSRKRDPISRPSASVCQEVFGLSRTGGSTRVCKVVRATYDLVVCRADVVMVEIGVDKRCLGQSSVD